LIGQPSQNGPLTVQARLSLPPQTKRPLWDKNRRVVIKELMAKAQAQAAAN